MNIYSKKVLDQREEIKDCDLDHISGGRGEGGSGFWICPSCKKRTNIGKVLRPTMQCSHCNKIFKREGHRYVEVNK